MEFKENAFIHRSVVFCHSKITSKLGDVYLHQIEYYVSSDFLVCFKPERFHIEHVFFSFDKNNVLSFYKLFYKDSIVQFQLYFYDFVRLFIFLHHYDDDYNLHEALSYAFHDCSVMCTFNDCLYVLFANSSRESIDVLEPVVDSEQRGLFDDELSF